MNRKFRQQSAQTRPVWPRAELVYGAELTDVIDALENYSLSGWGFAFQVRAKQVPLPITRCCLRIVAHLRNSISPKRKIPATL
jgi:hypothetical protein